MKLHSAKCLVLFLAASLFLAPFPAQASAEMSSTFLYSLANFYGKVPYNDVRIHVDRDRDEVYVLDRGVVRVFNDTGMEFFWFGDDPELMAISDLAVDEKGDLFLLSYDPTNPADPKHYIIRCNYRGIAKEKIPITGSSPEFSRFYPNSFFYRDGKFLLLSSSAMRVVVTDRGGRFLKEYDLADIIGIPEKDRPNAEIFGFNLDSDGNMLFTVSAQFQAYIVTPEGKLAGSFGKAGSAPGRFGIVSGIARDDQGNYIVAERLRSVVMVFSKEFQFLKEFGYRGDKPDNLIRPNQVAVGNAGKIFVTQVRNRGVSVFSVTSN